MKHVLAAPGSVHCQLCSLAELVALLYRGKRASSLTRLLCFLPMACLGTFLRSETDLVPCQTVLFVCTTQ